MRSGVCVVSVKLVLNLRLVGYDERDDLKDHLEYVTLRCNECSMNVRFESSRAKFHIVCSLDEVKGMTRTVHLKFDFLWSR